MEYPAPPELQPDHVLPSTVLRLVLDPEGQDHSAEIPWDSLKGECLAQYAHPAPLVIESQSERLAELIERGETRAQAALPGLIQAARARMELDDEIARLSAFAQVNPWVRPDEIERLKDWCARLAEQIDKAYFRLDALRLSIAYRD